MIEATEESAIGKRYNQDEAFQARTVTGGRLSRDATFAIYELVEPLPGKTEREDSYVTSLWKVNLDGGTSRRLSARGTNATSAELTPDGQTVFFLGSNRDGEETAQIYKLALNGGEAEAVTTAEQGIQSFALSPDGQWIVFTTQRTTHDANTSDDFVRVSHLVYQADDVPGYLEDHKQAIHLLSVETGQITPLTQPAGIVRAMCWSPNSRHVAAVISGKVEQKTWPMLGELSVLGLDGSQTHATDDIYPFALFWSGDCEQVGYVTFPDADLARQPQVLLVNRNGGAPVSRTPDLLPSVCGPIVGDIQSRAQLTPDGAHVIVPITDGGETRLYKVALSGPLDCQPITQGKRTCGILDRAGKTLLITHDDLNTPSELRCLDLASGEERRLTDHNREWSASIAWPIVHRIVVESAPGVQVEGWVLIPVNGDPPFPTVLDIHGGPQGGWGYAFNKDLQALAGAGYAVAFANSRGSTGYGDAFSTAILGSWGYPELEDFNAFLDELVRQGIADGDRLGVTGFSGGGHLSAWLACRTNRFKAAAPESGSYNMITSYGASDVGTDLTPLEIGGTPQEEFNHYWDLSPVAHAHKCKTPVLLIHGENDIRCPYAGAKELFTALKVGGCEVELLTLKNCNHGGGNYGLPRVQRIRMGAIIDWFDRHL